MFSKLYQGTDKSVSTKRPLEEGGSLTREDMKLRLHKNLIGEGYPTILGTRDFAPSDLPQKLQGRLKGRHAYSVRGYFED